MDAQPQRLLQAQPLLMLLDGHAMVHRAWHAIQRPLTVRATGQEVRGVYGFAQMLRKAMEDFQPTHLAIAFDLPTPTFRHAQFEAYKAQRPQMAPELAEQFPHVRRLMEAFQVPIYEMDGLEADDLLGALSRQAEAEGIDVLIMTGDTDVLQLVSPRVRVVLQYRMGEQLLFDEIRVRERYGGLTPAQMIDLKALRGDPSDNIPGIPGVGEKTAVRLLLEFGTVRAIYDNLDRVPEKQRALLEAHRGVAFLGLDLVALRRDAPVRLDLETSRWGRYRRADVVEFLRELEFFSLVKWVPAGESDDGQEAAIPVAPTGETVQLDYTTVTDEEALATLVGELTASSGFAFDVETAPLDPRDRRIDPLRSDLVGLSFATAPGRAWYVPVGHLEGLQLSRERVLERLGPVLRDAALPKVAHKANYDVTLLTNLGVEVGNVAFDTMLAAHLLGHKAIGLKNLALDLLGVEMTPIDELIGSGRKQVTFAHVPVEGAAAYSCADADMTYRLWQVLAKDLEREGLAPLFKDVEMPLAPVLVEMQVTGIKLDSAQLAQMGDELGTRLAELEEATYASVGHRFNMNSPSQLGELLFGELRLHEKMEGMGRPKRTRTGAYSTDAAILDSLRDGHEVVNLVLENRQLAKLKSTYVDALPVLVNPRTGRVHTSYNQAGSVTGRVSSNDPNLQNIPTRTDLGRRIRTAFIPGERGWLLLAADYSQIELRVLAHLSQDPALLDAFHQDLDIHASTAAQVYGVPMDAVTADQRRIAKVLNFGVIYGVSGWGISHQTGLSMEEGRQFIASYFERYQGAADYRDRTVQQAREQGYVQTMLGRRRATPEIHSSNPAIRQATQREAVNMPIQGTAAEIMKLAMVRVRNRMGEMGLRSRMLLQVHDELIFEAPAEEIEALKGLVLEEMPRALDMDVPLKVTVKTGASWGELE